MPDMHENGPGESRLDRMERMMALLIEGHVQFREDQYGSTTSINDC